MYYDKEKKFIIGRNESKKLMSEMRFLTFKYFFLWIIFNVFYVDILKAFDLDGFTVFNCFKVGINKKFLISVWNFFRTQQFGFFVPALVKKSQIKKNVLGKQKQSCF